MSFYADRVVPVLIDLAMRNKRLRPYRERIVGAADGRVLEVGVGSGLNLSLYRAGVRRVIALDPSPRLLARARNKAREARVVVEFIQGSAEAMPLDDDSVDTVVMTWTGCSIPDVAAALAEMRRVLRPTGRLLFVEHGRAPELRVARWQAWLTPHWLRLSGGCHLDRQIDALIEAAGFRMEQLATGYMGGLKPFTFMYEGIARPR
jgi:ubiquinone/menaquinone biosynthesis C-methylase UbiE